MNSSARVSRLPEFVTMLRTFKKAFLATFRSLQRASRRTTPSLFGLENRTMLSGQGVGKAVVESVQPRAEAAPRAGSRTRSNPSKQTAFVVGLYIKVLPPRTATGRVELRSRTIGTAD